MHLYLLLRRLKGIYYVSLFFFLFFFYFFFTFLLLFSIPFNICIVFILLEASLIKIIKTKCRKIC